MLEQIKITMLTTRPLRSVDGLTALLTAFAQQPALAPTHWGPDERAREPFDRDALVTRVSSWTDEFGTPGLRRQRPPRYEGYFHAKSSGLSLISLEATKQPQLQSAPAFFELGDALATAMTPVFGAVHLIWDDSPQDYSVGATMSPRELQRYGLVGVCTRTWFGPHIVPLIGRDLLAKLPVPVTDTVGGGVVFDLAPEPWTANSTTLAAAYATVMDVLRPSGVFGDYTNFPRLVAGSNWQPVPDTAY